MTTLCRDSSLSGNLAIPLNMDVFVGLEDGDVVVRVLDTKTHWSGIRWTEGIELNSRESLDQGVFVFDGAAILAGFILGPFSITVSLRSLNIIESMVRAYFSSSSGEAGSLRVT